jgi:hypothetical protein
LKTVTVKCYKMCTESIRIQIKLLTKPAPDEMKATGKVFEQPTEKPTDYTNRIHDQIVKPYSSR